MNEIGLRECHAFEAAGQQFLYLVPSAAVFALDETSQDIVALLRDGPLTRTALLTALESQRSPAEVDNSLMELQGLTRGNRLPLDSQASCRGFDPHHPLHYSRHEKTPNAMSGV